jgi:hypothetical protein
VALLFYRDGSRPPNVKILVTLSYGEGCIGTEEFVAEDLGEEDIVGDVFGFEAVATDGAVGASEVSWFPREVEGAEGGGNVLGELGASGGVNGLGGREAFEIPESVEGLDKFLGVAEDGDEVGLGTGTGSLAGFPVGRQRGGRERGVFPEGG